MLAEALQQQAQQEEQVAQQAQQLAQQLAQQDPQQMQVEVGPLGMEQGAAANTGPAPAAAACLHPRGAIPKLGRFRAGGALALHKSGGTGVTQAAAAAGAQQRRGQAQQARAGRQEEDDIVEDSEDERAGPAAAAAADSDADDFDIQPPLPSAATAAAGPSQRGRGAAADQKAARPARGQEFLQLDLSRGSISRYQASSVQAAMASAKLRWALCILRCTAG
jgi:hypothetical protein